MWHICESSLLEQLSIPRSLKSNFPTNPDGYPLSWNRSQINKIPHTQPHSSIPGGYKCVRETEHEPSCGVEKCEEAGWRWGRGSALESLMMDEWRRKPNFSAFLPFCCESNLDLCGIQFLNILSNSASSSLVCVVLITLHHLWFKLYLTKKKS